MKKLYFELEKKRNYYAKIKEKAEKSLKGAPKEGRLRVANRKGAPQYYLLIHREPILNVKTFQLQRNLHKEIMTGRLLRWRKGIARPLTGF